MSNGITQAHKKELLNAGKGLYNLYVTTEVSRSVVISYYVDWGAGVGAMGGRTEIVFSHNKAAFKKEILALIKLLIVMLVKDIRPYKNRK